MPIPVLIDTDMALDDWMAILYLLRCPQVEVQAISVAATGEAHARPGTTNALRLLSLAGHAPIPVAAGRAAPLKGAHAFPLAVRVVMDAHFWLRLPAPCGRSAPQDAAALITGLLEAAAQPVQVVALGPLTNLAEVFLARPELAHKVAGITIMGGALDAPGNIESINPRIRNPYAEWNIYIDPYAANVVFSSGAPITLVPLDATNQVPLTAEYLERLRQAPPNPPLDFVRRALERIHALSRGGRGFYFWDPLAVLIPFHPEIAGFETCRLEVVEEEGPQCGRVVRTPDGYPLRVCVSAQREAFERLYLQGMGGLAG